MNIPRVAFVACLTIVLQSNAYAITGGTAETGFDPVGALVDASTKDTICTVTLITNGWALTAASCLFDALGEVRARDTMQVCLGADVTNCQGLTLDFVDVHPNFDGMTGDIAMLHLAGDVQALPVFPYNTGTLTSGTPFTWVGFGGTDSAATGSGIKRSAAGIIDDLTLLTFSTNIQSSSPCKADEGAPAIGMAGSNPTILGLVSYGDDACQVAVVHTRVDAYRVWIEETIQTKTPCNIRGGSCANGQACFPGVDGFQCAPTEGMPVGATCDPSITDTLACADGAVCIPDGQNPTEGTCRPFCRENADCPQADESCETVFESIPDVGACQYVPPIPSDMGPDAGPSDMGPDAGPEDMGEISDMGDTGVDDAGTGDDGGSGGGLAGDDGCGCAASATPDAPEAIFMALVALFGVRRRRLKRR